MPGIFVVREDGKLVELDAFSRDATLKGLLDALAWFLSAMKGGA